MTEMGRLEFTTPKEAWGGEASDFTPKLASVEMLEYLGDAIGIGPMSLVGTEHKTAGHRSLDILFQLGLNHDFSICRGRIRSEYHADSERVDDLDIAIRSHFPDAKLGPDSFFVNVNAANGLPVADFLDWLSDYLQAAL